METYGLLGCDPADAVDLYTRMSCLRVTATDLAVMGATLANGGVNLPVIARDSSGLSFAEVWIVTYTASFPGEV